MGNNLDARYTNGQETNGGSAGRQCRMKAGMRLQRGLIRLFLWFAQSANPQSAFTSVQEEDNKANLGRRRARGMETSERERAADVT